MHESTITSKGQTTIPKEIRDLLKLKPGDKIVFYSNDNKVFIEPVNQSITHLEAILSKKFSGKKLSVEQMNTIIETCAGKNK